MQQCKSSKPINCRLSCLIASYESFQLIVIYLLGFHLSLECHWQDRFTKALRGLCGNYVTVMVSQLKNHTFIDLGLTFRVNFEVNLEKNLKSSRHITSERSLKPILNHTKGNGRALKGSSIIARLINSIPRRPESASWLCHANYFICHNFLRDDPYRMR